MSDSNFILRALLKFLIWSENDLLDYSNQKSSIHVKEDDIQFMLLIFQQYERNNL